MTILDVNQQFASEKIAQLDERRSQRDREIKAQADKAAWLDQQVSAGRMIQVSATKYRVISGWDRGETFTVNRSAAGIEVVANHGLDTFVDGSVALYTARPEWHRLGNVIEGGTSDISTVLDKGGIAFDVEKRAARYSFDGELRTVDGQFVTVRSDTGEALGVVGSRYEVIQQRDAFGFLLDLVEAEEAVWETAGSMRGGSKVFVTMRLPENVVIDEGGLNDELIAFLSAINSHDGSSPAAVVLSPWRIACKNTERFAVRDARARWGIRHTKKALDRITEARRTLGLTVKYYETFAEEETTLARTDMAVADFHKLISDLWPIDEDANARMAGIAVRRTERLDAMFRAESGLLGRTCYAAERTITDYLDHVAPVRPGKTMTEEIARATRLLEGSDDDVKSRAHKRLMLLTRR